MDNKKSGCIECSRYGFIILNVAVLFTGILLALLGTWFYAVPASENLTSIVFTPANQNQFRAIILLVISVGSGCCVLAILGCCAAFSRSKCILITIFTLTVAMILTESVVLGYGIFYSTVLSSEITTQMTKTLAIDYAGDNAGNKESLGWMEMQSFFKCCGINTDAGYQNHSNVQYDDVTGSLWYREQKDGTDDWPNSCCQLHDDDETDLGGINCSSSTDARPLYLSERGCSDEAEQFLQTHVYLLIGITSLLLLYEVFSAFLSVLLYMDFIKKQDIYVEDKNDGKEYNKLHNPMKTYENPVHDDKKTKYEELGDMDFTATSTHVDNPNVNQNNNYYEVQEKGTSNLAISKILIGVDDRENDYPEPDYEIETRPHSPARLVSSERGNHDRFDYSIAATRTSDYSSFPKADYPANSQNFGNASLPRVVVEYADEPTSPYEF